MSNTQIELKDVLHLYLGCECLICYNGENRGLVMKLTGELIDNFDKDITRYELHLRLLSDMTEEEGKIYVSLGFGGIPSQQQGNLIYKTFMPPCFVWLLKEGFDLFDLIPSGQAIDKTTIK